ncbi:MAG: hypothetical protein PHS16_01435 [Candidatus Colwellbacteria bacterium]|jgi:hypothetical protein|nr:hypothetical protein [Candidatus Colwellbacteria bacterium]MCK9497418.1 hypothetical protein [Candidatus Colwellbacteria bacterium]MDD3752583.1 hypothetical protein [Candidatus Colwellbacteria bacterium]MDD4818617.1 hypothetical protein [Candidatus Colwellbacteria bacterium]
MNSKKRKKMKEKLAEEIYGKGYDKLCWRQQAAVDCRVEEESRKKS